jgi:hypothetical protein
VNWVYQLLKALLDFFRETPPPTVVTGKAPSDLQAELGAHIDAAKRGVSDKSDPGA